MSQSWYYRRDDKKFGPITFETLNQLATGGQIQPTDMVWREGLTEWVTAKSIKGLFPTSSIIRTNPDISLSGQLLTKESSMGQYYIRRGAKVIGPTSLENIQALWKAGKIKEADDISSDQVNWSPLPRFLQRLTSPELAVEEPDESVAEEAIEEAQEDESMGQEDASVNIAAKKQEKAMWTVTKLLGICATVLFALGFVLGIVFGYFPAEPKGGTFRNFADRLND